MPTTTSVLPHKRDFIGYFRVGQQAPSSIVFEFDGDLRQAKDRWKLHCERMGYKSICCRVFKVDLEHREKLRSTVDSDQFLED